MKYTTTYKNKIRESKTYALPLINKISYYVLLSTEMNTKFLPKARVDDKG